jgi:hypothetical protein
MTAAQADRAEALADAEEGGGSGTRTHTGPVISVTLTPDGARISASFRVTRVAAAGTIILVIDSSYLANGLLCSE